MVVQSSQTGTGRQQANSKAGKSKGWSGHRLGSNRGWQECQRHRAGISEARHRVGTDVRQKSLSLFLKIQRGEQKNGQGKNKGSVHINLLDK